MAYQQHEFYGFQSVFKAFPKTIFNEIIRRCKNSNHTCLFHCINTCWDPQKMFEHEACKMLMHEKTCDPYINCEKEFASLARFLFSTNGCKIVIFEECKSLKTSVYLRREQNRPKSQGCSDPNVNQTHLTKTNWLGGCPGWSESSLGAHSFCWFCHVMIQMLFPELSECPENEYEEFPQRMRDWLFRIMRELVSIALCSRVEWVSREWVWRIPPENEGLTLQDHQRTGEYCTVFQSWVSVQRMSMKDSPRERGTDSSGSAENWWVLHCVPELSECPENEYEGFPQRTRDWLFWIIRELVSIALCSRVEWVSREWV